MDKIKIIILSLIFILMCGCGYKEYLRDDLGDDVKKSATRTGCTYTFQGIPDDLKMNLYDTEVNDLHVTFADGGDILYCIIGISPYGMREETKKIYDSWCNENTPFEVKVNGKKLNKMNFISDRLSIIYESYIETNGENLENGDALISINLPQTETYKKGNKELKRVDTYIFNLSKIKPITSNDLVDTLKNEYENIN